MKEQLSHETQIMFSEMIRKARQGIEDLAKDLDTSSRDLWLCVQFAKKCDNVTQLVDRSWRWITHKYLPMPKQKPAPLLPPEKRPRPLSSALIQSF